MPNDFFSTRCDQNLPAWLEEFFYASPGICDDASTSSCCFKHPGWRRKPNFRHRFPVDIHHHASGAVDLGMVGVTDVSNPAHILRQLLTSPPFAANHTLILRTLFRPSEKELIHPRFPIRQPISTEYQLPFLHLR